MRERERAGVERWLVYLYCVFLRSAGVYKLKVVLSEGCAVSVWTTTWYSPNSPTLVVLVCGHLLALKLCSDLITLALCQTLLRHA